MGKHTKPNNMVPQFKTCNICGGSGRFANSPKHKCGVCNGTGILRVR